MRVRGCLMWVWMCGCVGGGVFVCLYVFVCVGVYMGGNVFMFDGVGLCE